MKNLLEFDIQETWFVLKSSITIVRKAIRIAKSILYIGHGCKQAVKLMQ